MNIEKVHRPILIPADSQLRNKSVAAASILIVAPAFLIWALPSSQEYLLKLFSENNSRTVFSLLILFYSLFSILAIMLITTGTTLIQTARKIHQSRRFPAPDMRVIRDTWLVTGGRAKYIAYLLTATGLLLFIGGASVPYYFHNLLLQLLVPIS
jgi:hypothetical protein